jgi:hypothetical protein
MSEPNGRFWSKVEKSGDCWKWRANTRKGYGSIKVNRKELYAHRHSWEIHNGAIPPGLSVLHKCDNPLCVRPDHLFIGTQKDNMSDCSNKGRSGRTLGEQNVFAVLKENEVLEIRKLAGVIPQCEIAKRFNVKDAAVSKIILRRTWRHL